MAKIWLKIWLKVKENGTKKNQIGENGGERKKILVWTLIHLWYDDTYWSKILPSSILTP